MARHVMTARRRAALRKAQIASARKRRGGRKRVSRRKKIAGGVGVLGVLGGVGFYRKNKWRIAEGKLIQSYVNAGTQYNGERMTSADVYRHAIRTFKDYGKADRKKEEKRFKKSIKQTIKRL